MSAFGWNGGRLARALAATALAIGAGAVQAQDIVVGQIGPFTGLPSPDASEINAGAKAYFDQVNEAGGVRGRKIALFTLDDQFKGDVFAERFKEAMARKPVALISPIGSAALSRLLKDKTLDHADIVIVNAIPGTEAFRTPGHPKLFHIRAGDKAQLDRIVQHCKTLGVSRLHVLHQDLPIGISAAGGVRETAAAVGGLTITSTQSKHDDAALQVAAAESAKADPQGVLVVGSPKFMADAALALRKAGVTRAAFALSYLATPLAVKVIGVDGARGLAITQTFPNPNSPNLPVQREFQATMRRFGPKIETYSPFHFEGYLSARVLVAALKKAGGSITPASVTAALHDIGVQDYGGFRIDFTKGNTGGNWVDIGVVSAAGRLVY